MSDAPEKPRIVGSEAGKETIREPFLSCKLNLLSSVKAGITGSECRKSTVFLNSSALCRCDGLTSSTNALGVVNAQCKANNAVTVLLPLCLEQLSKSRLLVERSTAACQSSGTKSTSFANAPDSFSVQSVGCSRALRPLLNAL